MTFRPWLYLVLLIGTGAYGAPAPDQPTDTASVSDIERVINTIEEPASRKALVEDLEVLLEAKKETSGQADEVFDATDLWQWAVESMTGAWQTITRIDPRHIVISSVLSIAVIAGALAIRWLVLRGLQRLYQRLASNVRESDEVSLPTMVTRTISLILFIVAVGILLQIWGVDVSMLLKTDMGGRFAETLLSIGFILVATVVLWHASDIVVQRMLRLGSSGLDQERRARRLDTLVPLLRSITQITIGILAGLLILSELGINIGPLLAGAGILGLAVGFGAQTLVKDLITGVTILLEDAASVDDVIETAGHIGKVEDMRIRVIQLRDLEGIVHILPYSEVTTIKNYTKDYSYYLFDVGVAYREDPDEVIEVLTKLSDEFCEDEDYKSMILEPLEILGVDRFDDSAVVVRARIKTTPKERWTVGRAFNRRIKKRFDEEGIEIPFPHTTLYMGEPKSGQAAPMPLTFAEKEEKILEKLAGQAAS